MRSPHLLLPVFAVLAACSGPAPTDASTDASPTREAGLDATTDGTTLDARDDTASEDTTGADTADDDVTDASDVSDASDAEVDASPALVRLTNIPESSPDCSTVIGPASGEGNHWAAVRLTPPSYPFHVRRIQYTTVSGASCMAGARHFVSVTMAMTNVPPSAGLSYGTFDVPSAGTTSPRVVTIDLPTEVVVPSGWYFYVEVQFTSSPSESPPCLLGCANEDPGTNFISNAQSPPFIWNAAGRNADFLIEAFGVPE